MLKIIIDGYNLIRQSNELSLIDTKDLESGRRALIQKCAAYKKVKPCHITIVFDAAKTDNSTINEDREAGIKIFYSSQGQTADEVIIKLLKKQKGHYFCVSSDNEILKAAKSNGHSYLNSKDFEKKMEQALMMEEDGLFKADPIEKKPTHKRWITQKKGPSKRLPKAKRRALKNLDKL